MSFKRKSRDRSAENTSGADDRAPKNEGEMSYELLRKYFDEKFYKKSKKMESKLHSDADQGEKSTSNSKVTKYNINLMLNWSKNWKT